MTMQGLGGALYQSEGTAALTTCSFRLNTNTIDAEMSGTTKLIAKGGAANIVTLTSLTLTGW